MKTSTATVEVFLLKGKEVPKMSDKNKMGIEAMQKGDFEKAAGFFRKP